SECRELPGAAADEHFLPGDEYFLALETQMEEILNRSRSYRVHRSVIWLRWACAQPLRNGQHRNPPVATGGPPFLLGVQSFVQQHFEVRLVPQSLLGGEGPGSGEVIFRQPDCDRWRRSGPAGPLAGNSRHGSLAEFASGFG